MSKEPVLMTAGFTQGWKLEDLCLKLVEEIEAKNEKMETLTEDQLPSEAKEMYQLTNRHNISLLKRISKYQSQAIEFRETLHQLDDEEAAEKVKGMSRYVAFICN